MVTGQGLLHIDHPLVLTALPQELYIFFLHMEFTVYYHIHILHHRQITDVFPAVPGVHPDRFRGIFFPDFTHEVSDIRPVHGMHRISAGKGNTGNVLTLAANPANRWIPKDYAIAHGIDPSLAENKDARFPRLQYGNNSNNSQLSTFWQGDSRYIRLQEITLNYHLATAFLRRIGVSSLDIQFVGNNLYVWDKVKLFDPEQARWNGRVYPIPSTYSLQLYVNL